MATLPGWSDPSGEQGGLGVDKQGEWKKNKVAPPVWPPGWRTARPPDDARRRRYPGPDSRGSPLSGTASGHRQGRRRVRDTPSADGTRTLSRLVMVSAGGHRA